MPVIRIDLRPPSADGSNVAARGATQWTPTRRRHVEDAGQDYVVLPATFLGPAVGEVTVAATGPGWVWRVQEMVTGGDPSPRYLVVPDVEGPLDYGGLAEVDPATLEPAAVPDAAWWAAVEELRHTAGAGGGGAVEISPYSHPALSVDFEGRPTLYVDRLPSASAGNALQSYYDGLYVRTQTPTTGLVTIPPDGWHGTIAVPLTGTDPLRPFSDASVWSLSLTEGFDTWAQGGFIATAAPIPVDYEVLDGEIQDAWGEPAPDGHLVIVGTPVPGGTPIKAAVTYL